MQCSYHPSNAARVQCTSCSRPVCAACDHRVKGFTYCQDCIVAGISMLARERYHQSRPKGKAGLAALCGLLLPGLGAVYNRQNIKALVHFVTTVGLFQLTAIRGLAPFFALAGVGFYFYTVIDAYRTAQAIAAGETAAANEGRFKSQLAKRTPAIGLTLIVCGILFVIQSLFGLRMSPAQFLPVALIVLGGYLLTRYFKRSRDAAERSEYTRPPYALIPGGSSDKDTRGAGHSHFSGRR